MKHKIYRRWKCIIDRCMNNNSKDYPNYGGRGITICNRWLKFENFFKDMGECPKGLTIERINNNLGYYKENCCWATRIIQARNRRDGYNKTGIRGIYWCDSHQKFRVRIGVDKKRIHVGYFNTIKQANNARNQAEQKYWA